MPKANRSVRLQRRRACTLFFLSVCLLFNGSPLLSAAAQQIGDPSSVRSNQAYDAGSQSSSRPRRIDSNRPYDDDGPLIRVALMTDVTDITITSSSNFIVLRSGARRDAEKIASRPIRFEIRQQLMRPAATREDDSYASDAVEDSRGEYRVEVGTVSDMRQARKVMDDLKPRFDESTSAVYDKRQDAYHVLIGKFNGRSEAMAMIEQLRHEGYVAAHIAPNYEAEEPSRAAKSASAKNGSSKTAKPQPRHTPEPAYQRLSQLVAVEGDHVLSASDDRLILTAANTGETPRRVEEPAPEPREEPAKRDKDYLETQQRDAERLWGAHAKPTHTETSGVTVDRALGGTSSVQAVSFLRVDGKAYRGEIQLILNSKGRINVVNTLPMEQYLRGVVPMELSPGAYPAMEALKAQAVAARTYALAHRTLSRDADFDLRDDTRSQVYGGLTAERDLTNRAVEETRGIAVLYLNDEGKLVPIDALYTANCGGRTENNEVIFGGKPVSYLRSVACQPDRQTFAGHDIVSNRAADSTVEADDGGLVRDMALLQVLGFLLPRRASSSYLHGTPDSGEMQNWIERAAGLAGRDAPRMMKDVTRLGGFALLLASAIYGEGHASLLLTPADVDYLLGGLPLKDTTPDVRANLALLLRDRILQLPAGLDTRTPLTRALAIETLAHAAEMKSRALQTGNPKSSLAALKYETAQPAEEGRLLIAETSKPASKETHTEAASVARPKTVAQTNTKTTAQSTTGLKSRAKSQPEMTTKEVISYSNTTTFDYDNSTSRSVVRDVIDGLEVEPSAWLFRSFGDVSYAVDRLTLIGGERVAYHLDSTGRVDFIEAAPSERGASSDRFSSVAQWQERVSAEEMQRRLSRAGVNVGPLTGITPTDFTDSNRVIAIDITGEEGSSRLHGPQLRSILGLKENLFVVDREMDARGRVTAFVFTGRGWGHGVGMCQVGAYGLARDGYSYTQILQKYYTGVKVQKVY